MSPVVVFFLETILLNMIDMLVIALILHGKRSWIVFEDESGRKCDFCGNLIDERWIASGSKRILISACIVEPWSPKRTNISSNS